jgi:ABC-type bacteriocin/lantibiotic exporter with double-glycine peptidase domain
MPDNAPVLTIQDLTFRYRDRESPAILDINLEVRPGELLLIAGASGCGKTTLVNLDLEGQYKSTAGSIESCRI